MKVLVFDPGEHIRLEPLQAAGEPGSDLGMLVASVVVDDEVDVELGRQSVWGDRVLAWIEGMITPDGRPQAD